MQIRKSYNKEQSFASRGIEGFTLIEIMIVVAIVAILASIAIPAYRGYIQRGKLVTAVNTLTSQQAAMEQFYQDNRTYLSTSGSSGFTSPCDPTSGTVALTNFSDWRFSCPSYSQTAYAITANGNSSLTSGFTYMIDQAGNQKTVTLPAGWPGAGATCFVTRKGQAC